MRKLAAACALATLTLAAGCGSDDGSDTTAAATAGSQDAQSSSAAAPSSTAGSASASGGAGSPTELTGTVGTTDDPDAYVITLTDGSGQQVTSLPAGDYTISVQDLSSIHNFHLTGDGVDEETTVPEIGDTTFDVSLTAGEYTFVCDPHPRMTGSFTVT